MKFNKSFFLKSSLAVLSFAMVLIMSIMPVNALSEPYDSYSYQSAESSGVSPYAYTPSGSVKSLDGSSNGISDITDMFIDDDGVLYLLDTNASKVHILDDNLNFKSSVAFTDNNEPITFSKANGIYVKDMGGQKYIFVADSENRRILKSDMNGIVVQKFLQPKTDIFTESDDFIPEKLVVTDSDNLIVLCRGIYKGAAVFSSTGDFLGFYGSNKVKVTAKVLYDYAWKKAFGSDKTASLDTSVPIEFTNLDIDEKGFIYTVTSSEKSGGVINRINFKSGNLLDEGGNFGDLEKLDITEKEEPSAFIDVCYMGEGIFSALDRTRSRVFIYNEKGDNITVFASEGKGVGSFKQPSAIETYNDKIYVYDSENKDITMFSLTEHGKNLLTATRLYLKGEYDNSIEYWEKVLSCDQSFSLAYLSIGRSMMNKGEYEDACKYFKIANAKEDYSQAYTEIRKAFLNEWLGVIMAVILVLFIAAVIAYKIIKKRKPVNDEEKMPTILSLIPHPNKNILYIVKEKKHIGIISLAILLAWFVIECIIVNATGFIFSTAEENPLNIAVVFASTVGLVFLFVIVNWLITAIFNGNGTFSNIFCLTCVSMVPYIIARVIRTVMSTVLTLDEASFMSLVIILGILSTLAILLCGLSQIHEFTAVGTVTCFLFTIVGIALVIFLMLLFGSVVAQITQLVSDIFGEIFRIFI